MRLFAVPILLAVAALGTQQEEEASIVPLSRHLRYGTPAEQDSAYEALLEIGTPEVWRQMEDNLQYVPPVRHRFLTDVLRSAPEMPTDDPHFRRAASQIARKALRSLDRQMRSDAAEVLVRLRSVNAMPNLMALLMHDQEDYAIATSALIRLTGVDFAPTPPIADTAQRTLAWRFWMHWWQAKQPGKVRTALIRWWPTEEPPRWFARPRAASQGEGEAALERWRRRW